MESGDLPFGCVESRRRLALRDVLTFIVRLAEQQEAMEALAADTDDLQAPYDLASGRASG